MEGYFLLAALLMALIFLGGCVIPGMPESDSGFLEGAITIGPNCPAIRNLSDPTCKPTPNSYNSWPIAIWTHDGKEKAAQVYPGLNGLFKVSLKSGNYTVTLDKPQDYIKSNLPRNVTIEKGKITKIAIEINARIK